MKAAPATATIGLAILIFSPTASRSQENGKRPSPRSWALVPARQRSGCPTIESRFCFMNTRSQDLLSRRRTRAAKAQKNRRRDAGATKCIRSLCADRHFPPSKIIVSSRIKANPPSYRNPPRLPLSVSTRKPRSSPAGKRRCRCA